MKPEEKREDDADLVLSASEEEEEEEVEEEEELEIEEGKTGGMATVMMKILGRSDVAPMDDPVLSKRKTPMMRALDEGDRLARETKRRRREKEARAPVALTHLDERKREREQELQKVATRAVVALFNAITQHQRADAVSDTMSTSSTMRDKNRRQDKILAAREVQRATKANIISETVIDTSTRRRPQSHSTNLEEDQALIPWARDDFLLEAAQAKDISASDAKSTSTKIKKKVRKDGQQHAFLYDANSSTRRDPDTQEDDFF